MFYFYEIVFVLYLVCCLFYITFFFLLLFLYIIFFYTVVYSSTIQLPQPGNQTNVATGTTNLTINATIKTSPTSCSWSGTGLTATQFYSSAFGRCQILPRTTPHTITCTNVPGGFSTSLTYLTAMTNNTSVSLRCDSAVVYSLSIIVKGNYYYVMCYCVYV